MFRTTSSVESGIVNTVYVNTPLADTKSGQFTAEFGASVDAVPIDLAIGFSDCAATAYGNLAAIVRFNTSGAIDVRDESRTNYFADAVVNYAANTTHHFRMEIDATAQTYDVYVTPEGGSEVKLATNYVFRAKPTQLNNICIETHNAVNGRYCNLTFPTAGGEGEGEGEGEAQGNLIVANVYPPYIDEGTLIILTAPAGTGYVWKKDGAVVAGETERELSFNPVTLSDAGVYTVEYDDGLKAAQVSEPFTLTVQAEGSVPAASLLGLALLASACGRGGGRLIRRRNG